MESKIWANVENAIFFTTIDGWQTDWNVFMCCGEVVTDMESAKEFVKSNMGNRSIGLATFEQMCMNNAEWDNL